VFMIRGMGVGGVASGICVLILWGWRFFSCFTCRMIGVWGALFLRCAWHFISLLHYGFSLSRRSSSFLPSFLHSLSLYSVIIPAPLSVVTIRYPLPHNRPWDVLHHSSRARPGRVATHFYQLYSVAKHIIAHVHMAF
jgi:hypothetical protein